MNRFKLIFFICLVLGVLLGLFLGFKQQNHSPTSRETCLRCHQNIVQQDLLSAKAKGPTDLIFFHSSHAGTMKLSCSPCHAGTAEEAHRTRPEKLLCLTCHDGTLAGNGCSLCHGPKGKIDITKELDDLK